MAVCSRFYGRYARGDDRVYEHTGFMLSSPAVVVLLNVDGMRLVV